MLRFSDHSEAGTLLGKLLQRRAPYHNAVVLALRAEAEELAASVAAVLKCPFVLQIYKVKSLPILEGSTIILVDDGFASVDEFVGAAAAARVHRPARLIAAAPVASKEVSARAANVVDDYVFLATPEPFHSVGFWYEDALRQVARAVFAGPNEARVRRKQPA